PPFTENCTAKRTIYQLVTEMRRHWRYWLSPFAALRVWLDGCRDPSLRMTAKTALKSAHRKSSLQMSDRCDRFLGKCVRFCERFFLEMGELILTCTGVVDAMV